MRRDQQRVAAGYTAKGVASSAVAYIMLSAIKSAASGDLFAGVFLLAVFFSLDFVGASERKLNTKAHEAKTLVLGHRGAHRASKDGLECDAGP